MSLTRGNVELLTIASVGPLMTAAGMDGTTENGTNLDLNGPISRAVRTLGYTVANPILVADGDIDDVADAEFNEFLDYVTLYALDAITSNLDDVDITVGPRSEKLSQLAEQVERKIARLLRALGEDMVTPSDQMVTINLAEHD